MIDDHPWDGELTDSGFFGAEGGDGAEALDPAVIELVDELVANTPPGRDGLLKVLLALQRTFDRVSWRVQELVADRYGLSPAQVAGLVSFFPGLSSERHGRLKVNVCSGTACRLSGADTVFGALAEEVGVRREDDEAPKVAVNRETCLGICGSPPAVRTHDRLRPGVTVKDARGLITEILGPPVARDDET